MKSNQSPNTSRRDFLATTAAVGAAGALAGNMSIAANAYPDGNDRLRVGLIGCGGRGTGAAAQNLRADPNVRLVAMGDAFQDRLNGSLNELLTNNRYQDIRGKVDVPRERQFVGMNAYQNVIENCDVVILATPPGFRPLHLAAAVNAGKNIFTEKPVAVDGPGIRSVLETYRRANQRNLSIVAGTQRRYQTSYTEAMRRIHNGDIGEITSARCYWNQGRLWNRARTNTMTDLEWHIRNWLYFTWLSGDHIVEQHIHNIDVCCWAIRNHPVKATGLGGREVRTQTEFGHIFDHHAIDYEFPNDVHVLSMCRQIPGCDNNVSEAVVGTRGKWSSPRPGQGRYVMTGPNAWEFSRRDDNRPYEHEHVVLYRAIRSGEPINALQDVAHSTLAAIMGRMSTYTGKTVTWEQALNSQEDLFDEARVTFETRIAMPAVAVPGQTELR